MESTTVIKIQSLEPYRHLFPTATAVDNTVKMGATVADTVDFIPNVVSKTQWQVENFVNQELKGLSTYKACEKLWYFVKHHIRYKKDERGIEQVRSPRRLIHDGVGDCDCFTTFIDTCLSVLKIPVINRITKYKQDFFQHIYPIVPLGNGKYIIMDCVVDRFNYEEPYTEKKDFKMDLQYLDGIEESENSLIGNVDTQDLFGWNDEMGDLGKLFKKRASTSAMPTENQGGKKGKKKVFQKIKTGLKKGLHVANRLNPATALLRAGILASMKLNVMKVPENLKWAYLTEDQAKAKGADMSKFGRLKKVLYKIEQIFFSAGGKPENLKKAILSGRGNRNKEVSGLGLIDSYEIQTSGISEFSGIDELLGEVYNDEFVNGLEGTDGLGVVAAGAAVAAASTVMGTLAALIKSIGSIFPGNKGKKGSGGGGSGDGSSDSSADRGGDGGEESSSEPSVNVSSEGGSEDSGSGDESSNTPATTNSDPPATTDDESEGGSDDDGTNGSAKKTKVSNPDEAPTGLKGVWENNKKWMKPVGIGVVVAGVLYAGYKMIKSHGEKKPASPGQIALNGFNSRRHNKRKRGKKNKRLAHGKKSNIALM